MTVSGEMTLFVTIEKWTLTFYQSWDTVEIHRLDQRVLDRTTALAGEADREMTRVSFTYLITIVLL